MAQSRCEYAFYMHSSIVSCFISSTHIIHVRAKMNSGKSLEIKECPKCSSIDNIYFNCFVYKLHEWLNLRREFSLQGGCKSTY